MFKLTVKAISILSALAIAELSTYPLSAQTVNHNTDLLNQIDQYSQEDNRQSIEQITNVNQLRDVSPTDWSYEALRGLVDRYSMRIPLRLTATRGRIAVFLAFLMALLKAIALLLAMNLPQA